MISNRTFLAFVLFSAATVANCVHVRAANLSLGIDPMVLEFAAPFGGETHASVTVTNSGSSDELVYARPIDWRTSPKGDVLFERPGTERAHSLTSALTLVPSSFVLHAGETRDVAVILRLPANKDVSAANLWGGFILRASASGASAGGATPGGTILVYDTVGSPRRHLGLTKLAVASGSEGPHLVAHVVNDGETYVRPVVHMLVERGQTVVLERTIPCNVLFAGDAREITASLRGLPAAVYRIHFLLDYGDDSIVDGVTDARLH